MASNSETTTAAVCGKESTFALQAGRLTRVMPWDHDQADQTPLITREWLVTNGLGGYASGTIAGVSTRRYHGLLIAALPAPLGA